MAKKQKRYRPRNASLGWFNPLAPVQNQDKLATKLQTLGIPREEIDFLVFGIYPPNLQSVFSGLSLKLGVQAALYSLVVQCFPHYISCYNKNKNIGDLDSNSHHAFFFAVLKFMESGIGNWQLTKKESLRSELSSAWLRTPFLSAKKRRKKVSQNKNLLAATKILKKSAKACKNNGTKINLKTIRANLQLAQDLIDEAVILEITNRWLSFS